MGDIPADRGGNRVFFNDVNQVGISTMIGDLAAMNLRVFHCLADAAIPNANQAHIDALIAHNQMILDASDVCKAREAATRELKPVTRLPAAPWGNVNQIAAIRMHSVPIFTGSSSDTLDIVRWLSRVFTICQANELSNAAAINLLIQGSGGQAADFIEQMRDDDKPLAEIVQQLEMRYGDLCAPEEARVKCNNMLRKEGEGLSEFIDRLRAMARMVARVINNDGLRRREMDTLVEANIRRVLSPSVRKDLEERVINRSRMGLPAFTTREIEKECLDLERKREERRSHQRDDAAALGRRQGRLLQCSEEMVFHLSEDEDSSASAEEADIGDEGMYNLIHAVKHEERKRAKKGLAPDPQRTYRAAFRKFNRDHPPPRFPRNQGPYAARAVAVGIENQHPNQGPPNRLDTGIKRTINDLLSMANVSRGSCIQCGQENHYMHSDACALKDKVLVDRPCMKCGRGLHSADDCMRVFQRQYVAPQGNVQGHQINQLPDVVPLNEQ